MRLMRELNGELIPFHQGSSLADAKGTHHPWNAIIAMTRRQRAKMGLYEVITDPPPVDHIIKGTTFTRKNGIIQEKWISEKPEPIKLSPYPELSDHEIRLLLEKLTGV